MCKGNCAYWTSRGLSLAEVIRKPSMFPKLLWVKILTNAALQTSENYNIVSYHCIEATKPVDRYSKQLSH